MPEEIELTPIKTDTGLSIKCRLACCRLPSFPAETCLIVSFTGVIENDSSYETGYRYMHSMIGDGFAACNPATLILDLKGLEYESGDQMIKMVDQRIITKVVVSEINRTGLTSLIRDTLFLNPVAELFDSVSDALLACDSAYDDFLRGGRKKIMAADF